MYSSQSSLPSKLYYFGKEGIVDILFIQKLEFLIRKLTPAQAHIHSPYSPSSCSHSSVSATASPAWVCR